MSTLSAKLGPSGGSPVQSALNTVEPTVEEADPESKPLGAQPRSSCPPPASLRSLAPLGLFISTHSHAPGYDDHLDSHDGSPLSGPHRGLSTLPDTHHCLPRTPGETPAASAGWSPQDGIHMLAMLHVGTSPAAPGLVEPTSCCTAAPSGRTAWACVCSSVCPPHRRTCHAHPGYTVAVPSVLYMCRPRQTPLPACSNPRTWASASVSGTPSQDTTLTPHLKGLFPPKRSTTSPHTSAHGRFPNCQHHQLAFLRLRAGLCVLPGSQSAY